MTSSKAGYYLWNFVVFKVDDTSTYICGPGAVTIPAAVVVGRAQPRLLHRVERPPLDRSRCV